LAAVILEILSGVRGPQEGSEALGISLTRYYQLEARALAALVQSLEPQAKGKRSSPEKRIATLESENHRLGQELRRYQTLLRVAQRGLGVASADRKQAKLGSQRSAKQTKRRRGTVRGLKLAQELSPPAPSETESGAEVPS
jgi:hypothetical protein